MPAPRVLRTLALGLDLAVFLWRRYSSVPQRSASVTDAPEAEPLDHKRVVAGPEDNATPDGGPEDGGAEDRAPERTQTVNFGLDGQNYAIDLGDQSAAELRETLGRYIAAGRQTGPSKITRPRPRAGKPARADGHDAAAIRRWALAHGHQIADRGPIPATVRQAYAARRRGRAG